MSEPNQILLLFAVAAGLVAGVAIAKPIIARYRFYRKVQRDSELMSRMSRTLQRPDFRFASRQEAELYLELVNRERYEEAFQLLTIRQEAIDADMG